jgi:hypothetical protein
LVLLTDDCSGYFNIDHLITPLAAQRDLLARIDHWLGAIQPR